MFCVLFPHRGSFDSPEWKVCVSQPSLPYVLKMLTGLCRWHTKTQVGAKDTVLQGEMGYFHMLNTPFFYTCTIFSHSSSYYTSHKRTLPLLSPLTPTPSFVLQLALVEVIPELHSLEQVASEEHIGTMAENLMEAMRDNPTCEEAVRCLWVGQIGRPKDHLMPLCIAVLLLHSYTSYGHQASLLMIKIMALVQHLTRD